MEFALFKPGVLRHCGISPPRHPDRVHARRSSCLCGRSSGCGHGCIDGERAAAAIRVVCAGPPRPRAAPRLGARPPAGSAVRDLAHDARAARRGGHAGGASPAALAERHVRRLRAQPQRGGEAPARRAGRRCREPEIRGNAAAARLQVHRARRGWRRTGRGERPPVFRAEARAARGAAVRESERRRGAGLLQRRPDGGDDRAARAVLRQRRDHRAPFIDGVQADVVSRVGDRRDAAGRVRPRGERAARRRARPDHGAARGNPGRDAALDRDVRSPPDRLARRPGRRRGRHRLVAGHRARVRQAQRAARAPSDADGLSGVLERAVLLEHAGRRGDRAGDRIFCRRAADRSHVRGRACEHGARPHSAGRILRRAAAARARAGAGLGGAGAAARFRPASRRAGARGCPADALLGLARRRGALPPRAGAQPEQRECSSLLRGHARGAVAPTRRRSARRSARWSWIRSVSW